MNNNKISNGMNQNNQKYSLGLIISIIIITIAVLALGYYLAKTSPQNLEGNSHDRSGSLINNGQLDSLIGKPLSDIQLTDKDGKIYTSESFKGKNTVLFFSEGLMCYPACWNQIAEFGRDPRFDTDQTQAISVMMDASSDWQRAISQMPELAKARTLFDVGGNVSRKFGLLTLPSSMHKGVLPGHTYIVLDKDGIVRYVDDDPNMSIANNLLINKIAEFK